MAWGDLTLGGSRKKPDGRQLVKPPEKFPPSVRDPYMALAEAVKALQAEMPNRPYGDEMYYYSPSLQRTWREIEMDHYTEDMIKMDGTVRGFANGDVKLVLEVEEEKRAQLRERYISEFLSGSVVGLPTDTAEVWEAIIQAYPEENLGLVSLLEGSGINTAETEIQVVTYQDLLRPEWNMAIDGDRATPAGEAHLAAGDMLQAALNGHEGARRSLEKSVEVFRDAVHRLFQDKNVGDLIWDNRRGCAYLLSNDKFLDLEARNLGLKSDPSTKVDWFDPESVFEVVKGVKVVLRYIGLNDPFFEPYPRSTLFMEGNELAKKGFVKQPHRIEMFNYVSGW